MSVTVNIYGKPTTPIEVVIPDDLVEELRREEKRFDPNQPRDPHTGEWIGGGPSVGEALEESPFGSIDRAQAGIFQAGVSTKPPPIDEEVKAAVTDRASAESYFKDTLGVQADFEGFPEMRVNEGRTFYQQLAQATKDAKKKFPVLNDPVKGLKMVASDDSVDDQEALRATASGLIDNPDVWAQTGPSPKDMRASQGLKTPGQTILINAGAREFADDHLPSAQDASLARADETAYGRLMHELGHASVDASGLALADITPSEVEDTDPEGSYSAPTMAGLFTDAGVGPADVAAISYYGSSSIGEGWAEIFAALNTPGYWPDAVPPEQRPKFLALQKAANGWAKENGVKGSII